MGIVSILGLIAGFIGSKIVHRQGQGFWLDIALGIVGALVGGFLFDLCGASGVRLEHLQHDRRGGGLGGGAVDLQRRNGSPSSINGKFDWL
jgi:uncharacterized membrane protein YeaQ/YmgE (transglycosylase-associated protein family)